MSLKVFHVVFVTVSVLLALGFSLWSLRAAQAGGGGGYAVMAVAALAAAVGLVFYGGWFLRKTRGFGAS